MEKRYRNTKKKKQTFRSFPNARIHIHISLTKETFGTPKSRDLARKFQFRAIAPSHKHKLGVIKAKTLFFSSSAPNFWNGNRADCRDEHITSGSQCHERKPRKGQSSDSGTKCHWHQGRTSKRSEIGFHKFEIGLGKFSANLSTPPISLCSSGGKRNLWRQERFSRRETLDPRPVWSRHQLIEFPLSTKGPSKQKRRGKVIAPCFLFFHSFLELVSEKTDHISTEASTRRRFNLVKILTNELTPKPRKDFIFPILIIESTWKQSEPPWKEM